MAENKFIKHLKGEQAVGSLVEIKNQNTPASFGNMPQGTSDSNVKYSDVRGDVTVVANGTMAWKINDSALTLAPIVNGDGTDYISNYAVSGAGLWVNSTYTFPSTGDPNHPVAMIFNPNTKWVLKLCGDNLIVNNGETLELTVVITIGSSNIISKQFTVREQATHFCKELVIDFDESNVALIKAMGLSTMQLQVLCGTADASARIYNGMTTLTVLQRKVDAAVVSGTFANVEEVMRDGILPSDYFNNAAYIAQIEDGDSAYAVFTRDGDTVALSGWAQPIPDQTGNSGKFLTTDGSEMSWAQLTISDVDSLSTELSNLQDQIDDVSGRGHFLALWNCATGLAESNPPTSPYTYQSGDYFIVGTVSSATPAVNYRPDGATYTTGVASTTVETNEVKVDDTYVYDGTNWKLQANSQRQYTFSGIAGSPYDNTNLGNALNGKVDETSTANQVYGTDNSGNQTTYTITQYLKNTATATDAISVYGTANTTWTNGINIGVGSRITSTNGIAIGVDASADVNAVGLGRDADAGVRGTAIGAYAKTSADTGIAIGCWNSAMHNAVSSAKGAYQFGVGTNSTARTLNVGWYDDSVSPSTFRNYQVLDGNTGLIPDARISTNITRTADLATVATTGSYNDLSDTPTIPAAQVNSDWNAVSGVAEILNKPSLATVATSGSYNDLSNKPTIPTVNDATLTIQKNGTNVATFTANASSNVTANISVPTTTNDLVNDSGFITSSDIPVTDVTVGGISVVSSGVAAVPTIPTVNNATITITQGGVTKGSFTLNQASGDTIALDAGGGVGNIDNVTITTNSDSEIQAIAVIDQNTGIAKTWTGTAAEYDAIVTKDPETEYIITDDIGGSATEIGQITEALNDKVDKGHQVIEFQEPTADNNYTWYRKYADGWVEQGGKGTSGSGGSGLTVVLPVEMSDTNYDIQVTGANSVGGGSYLTACYHSQTTTGFLCFSASGGNWYANTMCWQVSGMAA